MLSCYDIYQVGYESSRAIGGTSSLILVHSLDVAPVSHSFYRLMPREWTEHTLLATM